MDTTFFWTIVASVLLLALPAAVLAWMLRWSRIPGGRSAAAVVAGISIGLLMGPGVLGRARPEWHASLFAGGASERAALAEMSKRHAEEMLALTASGVTADAIEEHRARQRSQSDPLRSWLEAATRRRRAALDWAAQGMLALYFICIGGAMVPGAMRRRQWQDWSRWIGRSIAAGFTAALVACAVPGAIGAWLIGLGPREAIGFGLIMGAPGFAAILRPRKLAAVLVGTMACASCAVLIGWTAGLTAVAAGVFLGLMIPLGMESAPAARRMRRRLVMLGHAVALPAAAALLAVGVDLHGLASGTPAKFWWAVVIAVIWSSDGRWLAWSVILRRVIGERRLWSAGAECVNAGAGVMQLALTAVLCGSGLADGAVVAAGLLGAALVEVTRGARRWVGMHADSGKES